MVRFACRALALAFLFGLVCAASAQAPSSEGPSVSAAEFPAEDGFWSALMKAILSFNSRALMQLLGRPEFAIPAFVAINLIVFVETGLLIGFFLPGDSLLVTAGLIASHPDCAWNLPLLLATVSLSAIVGDTVGYSIGYKSGPRIFNREKSLFFNRDHLVAAQAFYEKHGGKTIILARFMPILRTFAPVVAGVAKMEYRRFLAFNVFGGIGWVFSMILVGFYLPRLLNQPLQRVFGPGFLVQDHIEKIVVIVVLLSISPGIYVWLRSKMRKRAEAKAQA